MASQSICAPDQRALGFREHIPIFPNKNRRFARHDHGIPSANAVEELISVEELSKANFLRISSKWRASVARRQSPQTRGDDQALRYTRPTTHRGVHRFGQTRSTACGSQNRSKLQLACRCSGNEVDGKLVEGFVESAEPLRHEIYCATVIDRRYRVGSLFRTRLTNAFDNGPR